MKIGTVDFFYIAMPVVTDAGDGSQDALVVRVGAGEHVGWGECEASPLTSIAAFVCPMSHGACRPVSASVLGQSIDAPSDIARIAATIGLHSMDLLQAAHTWSGIEMALWDLLGRAQGEPVWKLLGYRSSEKKMPYASQLFGTTPEATLQQAQQARRDGFAAAKFGWGPIGRGSLQDDLDQFMAAREGLGPDAVLLVDAGQVFGEDVEAAAARLPCLEAIGAVWLEEPFHGGALDAYGTLARRSGKVRLAGGEASHDVHMARHLIDHGGIGFVQIDCGRIGGIGPAKKVADHAVARGVNYVNHTFTSHLALSASIQPFAGLADHRLCEFPVAPQPVARDMTLTRIERHDDGQIALPDAPGLGIEINPEALGRYAVDVEIRVQGEPIFRSPRIS